MTQQRLSAGARTLSLALASTERAMEANENNNRFQITYTLPTASGPPGPQVTRQRASESGR